MPNRAAGSAPAVLARRYAGTLRHREDGGVALIELQMFPGQDGDCLLLTYGDQSRTRRVMIDGGRAATYPLIKPKLTELGGERIDVLVITHVDQDHILGVLSLFDDPEPPVEFLDIWFNGFDQLNDNQFESFGPVDGERFTAILTDRQLPWNKAFKGCAIEVGRPQFPFDDEAEFRIVAPDRTLLQNLIPTWTRECAKSGLIPGVDPERPEPGDSFERFGALDVAAVRQLAASQFKPDTSKANMTSIGFLFEYDDTRILFTGDGDVPRLIASLRPMAEQEGGRVRIDALKVPHHGSGQNISRELLEIIDCKRYLISTSGVRYAHPDDVAMARILAFGGHRKELVFNYESRAALWRNEALQAEFDYTVIGSNGADGFALVSFE